MKNKFIFILILIGVSCKNNYSPCTDVMANKVFKNKGYVLYFKSSQDAMVDIWFFPVCLKNEEYKTDSTFSDNQFKNGISFKLPITGRLYKKLLLNSYESTVYDRDIPKKIFYCPALMEFDKPENSTFLYSTKSENWNLNLQFRNRKIKLSYFVSNVSNIKLFEPLKSSISLH